MSKRRSWVPVTTYMFVQTIAAVEARISKMNDQRHQQDTPLLQDQTVSLVVSMVDAAVALTRAMVEKDDDRDARLPESNSRTPGLHYISAVAAVSTALDASTDTASAVNDDTAGVDDEQQQFVASARGPQDGQGQAVDASMFDDDKQLIHLLKKVSFAFHTVCSVTSFAMLISYIAAQHASDEQQMLDLLGGNIKSSSSTTHEGWRRQCGGRVIGMIDKHTTEAHKVKTPALS